MTPAVSGRLRISPACVAYARGFFIVIKIFFGAEGRFALPSFCPHPCMDEITKILGLQDLLSKLLRSAWAEPYRAVLAESFAIEAFVPHIIW